MPVRIHADPDPGVFRGSHRGFPRDTDVREEVVARGRLLGEHLVAAVAVVADGGTGDEHGRRAIELGERARQQIGSVRAALEDLPLAFGRPLLVADARTGEVDDPVETFETGRVDRPSDRIPCDLARTRLGPHDAHDPVALRLERGAQCGADQTARPGDGDVHSTCSSTRWRPGRLRYDSFESTQRTVQRKPMLRDFKNFIMRGNVLDLAVAVVVGAAFNTVVQSLVANVLNPIAAAIFGKPDFSDALAITLREGDGADADTVLRLGAWITDIISFLIVALSVFLIVKVFETLQDLRKTDTEVEEASPVPSDEAIILGEIRDLLRAQA